MNPDRLDAALRLLQDSGDITPQAARTLTQINDDEQTDPDCTNCRTPMPHTCPQCGRRT